MSDLSSALGGSAPKHAIVCGGKEYPVGLVTQNVKVAYEKALYQKARAALAEFRGVVDKDYYERKTDALLDHYFKGHFALESEFSRAAMARPGGTLLLLSLLMGRSVADGAGGMTIIPFPELDLINVASQAPDEVAAVLKVVLAESFPAMDVTKAEAAAAAEGEIGPKAPPAPTPGPFG